MIRPACLGRIPYINSAMGHLALGIDQGHTKTCIAITDEKQNVLYEDYSSNYDQYASNREKHRRVIIELLKGLNEFKASPLNVFIASNGYMTRDFVDIFQSLGFATDSIEIFNDTHGHYGLTAMPGHCFMLASGTYWNLMFYDHHNDSKRLPGNIWKRLNTDGLTISGYGFANCILKTYRDYKFRGINHNFIHAVEDQIRANGKSIRFRREQVGYFDDVGHFSRLSELLPKFRNLREVDLYINQALDKICLLLKVFAENIKIKNFHYLFVGGSLWSNDFLLSMLDEKARRQDIQVIRAQGNPAIGAIHIRLKNPEANIRTLLKWSK